jgi:hypothetical protein
VLQEFVGHEGRITRAVWGALNRTIVSAGEDGTVRLWDVEVRTCAAHAHALRRRLRSGPPRSLHVLTLILLVSRRRGSSWLRAEITRSR